MYFKEIHIKTIWTFCCFAKSNIKQPGKKHIMSYEWHTNLLTALENIGTYINGILYLLLSGGTELPYSKSF